MPIETVLASYVYRGTLCLEGTSSSACIDFLNEFFFGPIFFWMSLPPPPFYKPMLRACELNQFDTKYLFVMWFEFFLK